MGRAVIAIHGSAGAISRARMTLEREREYVVALLTIVESGQKMLATGAGTLDTVAGVVQLLEGCPLFNVGIGVVFTHDQIHELDACVMSGYSLQADVVAGAKHLRNPMLAARLVLEESLYVLLISEGAENFAFSRGVGRVENGLSSAPEHLLQLQEVRAGGEIILDHRAAPLDGHQKMGTVDAVTLDLVGNLAVVASADGIINKLPGRASDSPLPGAGCCVNNASVTVSCTGTGEVFMRTLAAYDIAALTEYGQLGLYVTREQAAVEKLPVLGGSDGLIAVNREGNVVLPFNSEDVYRAWCYTGDTPTIDIYRKWKKGEGECRKLTKPIPAKCW